MEYGKLKLDLADVKPGQRIYLGLSGGLDSAYLAWRLLSLGHPLLLHHCSYKTTQNRWPHEDEAYVNILNWLAARGLTDWTIILSEFAKCGSVPYWFLDYEYLFWIAGAHLRNHPNRHNDRSDIEHVVVGSHKESRRTFGDPTFNRIWETLCRTAEREIKPLEPMKRYDRTQILRDMPPDLVKLCWSCRTPKDGKPCGKCSTCKAVDPALRANGLVMV